MAERAGILPELLVDGVWTTAMAVEPDSNCLYALRQPFSLKHQPVLKEGKPVQARLEFLPRFREMQKSRQGGSLLCILLIFYIARPALLNSSCASKNPANSSSLCSGCSWCNMGQDWQFHSFHLDLGKSSGHNSSLVFHSRRRLIFWAPFLGDPESSGSSRLHSLRSPHRIWQALLYRLLLFDFFLGFQSSRKCARDIF